MSAFPAASAADTIPHWYPPPPPPPPQKPHPHHTLASELQPPLHPAFTPHKSAQLSPPIPPPLPRCPIFHIALHYIITLPSPNTPTPTGLPQSSHHLTAVLFILLLMWRFIKSNCHKQNLCSSIKEKLKSVDALSVLFIFNWSFLHLVTESERKLSLISIMSISKSLDDTWILL